MVDMLRGFAEEGERSGWWVSGGTTGKGQRRWEREGSWHDSSRICLESDGTTRRIGEMSAREEESGSILGEGERERRCVAIGSEGTIAVGQRQRERRARQRATRGHDGEGTMAFRDSATIEDAGDKKIHWA